MTARFRTPGLHLSGLTRKPKEHRDMDFAGRRSPMGTKTIHRQVAAPARRHRVLALALVPKTPTGGVKLYSFALNTAFAGHVFGFGSSSVIQRESHNVSRQRSKTMSRINLLVVVVCLVGFVAAGADPVFAQGEDDCNVIQDIGGDGTFFFNTNTGSVTTDGVTDCGLGTFTRDVWFVWSASVSGTATLSTCGQTNVDTKVAAYDFPSACPPPVHRACSDDDCGGPPSNPSPQSSISWAVFSGQSYRIRIGGFNEDKGSGTFTIATTSISGACCLPDGSCQDSIIDLDCAAGGGIFHGQNSTCATTICTGACCLPDGSCQNVVDVVCAASGGTFNGLTSTCAASICTPVGSGFTYQGQLNLNGAPLNDSVDFRFTLWDTDGSLIGDNMIGGVAAIDNVTVVDGLFSVEVNSAAEFGPNAFNGAARWLEIDVKSSSGSTYTTLSPRRPLTATPYATFAKGGA